MVTKHAMKRMKERCGINKSSSERLADIAYKKGVKHSEVPYGSLKKWMDNMYLSHKSANQMRLYGDKIYIFRDNLLITVMQIPNNLQNKVNKVMKRKNINK